MTRCHTDEQAIIQCFEAVPGEPLDKMKGKQEDCWMIGDSMKFRKKPIIIDAEQYKPGMEDGFNFYEITGKFICYRSKNAKTFPRAGRRPVIETLEGNHEITPTDWIVTGVKGERYPVKDDIFWMTHEKVED